MACRKTSPDSTFFTYRSINEIEVKSIVPFLDRGHYRERKDLWEERLNQGPGDNPDKPSSYLPHTFLTFLIPSYQVTDQPNLKEFARKEGNMQVIKSLKAEDENIFQDVVSGRHPKRDVVVEKFNTAIYYETLQVLAPPEWLNDEIINFYFKLLVEAASSEWNRIHCFSTYFVEKCTEKVFPHTFLIPSSYLPHTFLIPSSYLPHLRHINNIDFLGHGL